jgi:hypothetical protein
MSTHPDPHRNALIVALVVSTFLWVATGTGAVATNTFGVGDRMDRVLDRVRLAIDPPPDREIAALIEVKELPPLDVVTDAEGRGDVGGPATPKPRRKPVDVKLRAKAGDIFASQHTNDWCSPAGIQMVLAMHQVADNSVGFQRKLANSIDRFESWRDSHNGGWGPASIAEALAANGVEGYEVRAYGSRALALRDSARALSLTRAPVILIAWRGAHTWVMTGYRANADPIVFRNARITGAYIYDPWYPRVSSIWGPSDKPGTFQDASEMERNFLRWDRPEGDYVQRDGKFLAIVPTIPLKDQPAAQA